MESLPPLNRTKIPEFLEQYKQINRDTLDIYRVERVYYLYKTNNSHYVPNTILPDGPARRGETDLEKLVEFIKWCNSSMVFDEKYTDNVIGKLMSNISHVDLEPVLSKNRALYAYNEIDITKLRKYVSLLSNFRFDVYKSLFSDILTFEDNKQNIYKQELFEAAQYGDYDKVLVIMENKHPSINNDDINKAQDVAIWNGYNNIVQIFIQYWIQGYGDYDTHNMIRLGMARDNYDLVESLINLHVDPDDNLCNSSLYCACLHRYDINMIDLLIKLKADVNWGDKYKRTPLHTATMNGNIDIVKRLLDAKSDFNAASPAAIRNTPLEIAQARGYDEILKLFR